ncbi:AraC family ligand binding domain-containing protein [Kiloniella sp. b19]|uniref:AraC family ligand binding domain-containing protein n=1 Tax=Kiloniella sp. GXU_MW_B19 TaxID=3141326 RepID=UPI0031DA5756
MSHTSPKVLSFADLDFRPRFEYGDQARIAELCGTGEKTELGSGFARFKCADIPWTVRYDEMLLVLEGQLTVLCGEDRLTAGSGDCIWLPRGTELRYRSEEALVFYAIHPANWKEPDR